MLMDYNIDEKKKIDHKACTVTDIIICKENLLESIGAAEHRTCNVPAVHHSDCPPLKEAKSVQQSND